VGDPEIDPAAGTVQVTLPDTVRHVFIPALGGGLETITASGRAEAR
jgi:hypothetical protein